jgi:hypothetical protein
LSVEQLLICENIVWSLLTTHLYDVCSLILTEPQSQPPITLEDSLIGFMHPQRRRQTGEPEMELTAVNGWARDFCGSSSADSTAKPNNKH